MPTSKITRYPIPVTRYPIAPPEPEQEEHTVKDVFEHIVVQYTEPFRMMFYRYRNQCDT